MVFNFLKKNCPIAFNECNLKYDITLIYRTEINVIAFDLSMTTVTSLRSFTIHCQTSEDYETGVDINM